MISRSVLLLFVFGLVACGGSGGGGNSQPSSSAASSVAVSSSVSSVEESSSSASSEPSSSSSSSSSIQPVTATHPLNDTGITGCVAIEGGGDNTYIPCPVASFPGQDGEHGRDAATLTKTGGGVAGFDFTKLDADGQPLSADATEWHCVRDNHTGLIWEVKTHDGGLRDQSHTYSWFNPDNSTNGGDAGIQDTGWCAGSACDTHAYTLAVNAAGLCGANDWRLPTVEELLSIAHNGRTSPAIDTDYFPMEDGSTPRVWTSTPALGPTTFLTIWNPHTTECENDTTGINIAYAVSFYNGGIERFPKSGGHCVNNEPEYQESSGGIYLVRNATE
ncbi:putative lipoprotein [Cellvibrio japonicus Ueda107]|uniref:Putative lipoprotein n=2 Tax=Cellvibrio japonicus TaxID=155077 RepID=B3PCA9_CELJU|nr:putative lipoprotein [Cellvibrio japonicus Ueda107]